RGGVRWAIPFLLVRPGSVVVISMRTNDKTALPAGALPLTNFEMLDGVSLRHEIAMTKSELIRNLAKANPSIQHREVEAIVTLMVMCLPRSRLRGGIGSRLRGPRRCRHDRHPGLSRGWHRTCRLPGCDPDRVSPLAGLHPSSPGYGEGR